MPGSAQMGHSDPPSQAQVLPSIRRLGAGIASWLSNRTRNNTKCNNLHCPSNQIQEKPPIAPIPSIAPISPISPIPPISPISPIHVNPNQEEKVVTDWVSRKTSITRRKSCPVGHSQANTLISRQAWTKVCNFFLNITTGGLSDVRMPETPI